MALKKRILFYGDSNTYGYDPRGFGGGRYPASSRWPDILAKELAPEAEVIADGTNGLTIPGNEYEFHWLDRFLTENQPASLFGIMLGSNDWLNMERPDPKAVAERMERAVRHVQKLAAADGWKMEILLMAPPQIVIPAGPMAVYDTADGRLSEAYRRVADACGTKFIDTAAFQAELAYDGVHLSENGHREFAEKLFPVITGCISCKVHTPRR